MTILKVVSPMVFKVEDNTRYNKGKQNLTTLSNNSELNIYQRNSHDEMRVFCESCRMLNGSYEHFQWRNYVSENMVL